MCIFLNKKRNFYLFDVLLYFLNLCKKIKTVIIFHFLKDFHQSGNIKRHFDC